ncbi:MAG: GNAT family N-acetyltransferase [Thermomicrobiales bacterium]
MNTPEVRPATAADQQRVVGALALAFVRDPVTRWTYPDPQDFLTHWPDLVRAFGGRAFEYGTAYYAGEFAGAALWLAPGVQPDDALLGSVIERTVSPQKLQVVTQIFKQMAQYHPAEPHWSLPLIGVDPNEQGRGFGAALLRHGLERVDRERRPAYLESTNSANIPLYERHGFEVLGTIQIEDAPPLVPMLRPARLSTITLGEANSNEHFR